MGINTENGFVEYRHIHTSTSKYPAVTLKLDVDQENQKIKCSFAVCHPNDNFSRSIGRTISTDRMEKGEFIEFDYDREKSLTDNVVDHLTDIMTEKVELPDSIRVMELARAYYYMDYIFAINEVFSGNFNPEMNNQECSKIILPNTEIIGA